MISAPRVLIESPTFQNQRIGVARVYEGAQTANAIMQGADQVADLAFRTAAENAERQGQEMALAASRSDVMGIDPNTGEPIALAAMGNMGRIGSEAYRRVINTRFQQSIEEEIRNQATILSAEYDGRPDGVALYTSALADYVSSMSANATGQWRGIIEDTGTSYINRTRATLLAREMSRARSAMASASQRANADAMSARQAIVAQLGPSAFGTFSSREVDVSSFPTGTPSQMGMGGDAPLGFSMPMGDTSSAAIAAAQGDVPLSYGGIANAIGAELRVSVADVVEAGIIDRSAADALLPAEREADLFGMTTYYINQLDVTDPANAEHVSRLRRLIGSRDIAGIMREAPLLAPYVEHLVFDANAAGEYDRFANGMLLDRAELIQQASEPVRLEAEAIALEASLAAQQGQADFANQLRTTFARMNTVGISLVLERTLGALAQTRASIPMERDEDRRSILQERVDSTINAVQEGLFDSLARMELNQDEVDRVASAFASRNPDRLEPRERHIYEGIRLLSRFDTEVFDNFADNLDSYRSRSARFIQARDEIAARDFAEDQIFPRAGLLPNLPADQIAAFAADLTQAIDAAPTMTDGVRNSALNLINTNAARGMLGNAFFNAENALDIDTFEAYARNGLVPAEGLPQIPEEVISAIDMARSFAAQTGNASTFPTEIGRAVDEAGERIRLAQQEAERIQTVQRVALGNGNYDRASDREAANAVLAQVWSEETGQPLPADLLDNPEYLSDPQTSAVLSRIYSQTNFLPQMHYDAFNAVGRGAIRQNMGVVLSHWERWSNRPDGTRPAALNAMSQDVVGMLDTFAEAAQIFGTDAEGRARFSEIMRASSQFRAEGFDQRANAYLGEPFSDFMLGVNGYVELPADQQRAFDLYASHLMAFSSVAVEGGTGAGYVRERLETRLSDFAPDSEGIVQQFGSDGRMTSRTPFDLSKTVPGYERDFIRYVNDEIALRSDASPVMRTDEVDPRQVGNNIWLRSSMPERRSTLVPIPGRTADGGVLYQVYELNLRTDEITMVMRNDEPGQPLIISTQEPGFRAPIDAEAARNQAEELRQGRATREMIGVRRFFPQLQIESVGTPPNLLEQY